MDDTFDACVLVAILTICACTPPLNQVMQLWDFLLAWGIHLNILCIIAQLYLIRGELMAHARYAVVVGSQKKGAKESCSVCHVAFFSIEKGLPATLTPIPLLTSIHSLSCSAQ
jgi:hypothetical protein